MALVVSLPQQWTLTVGNTQYINLGPFVDGTTLSNATPTYVNDLVITASLYLNRNLKLGQNGSLVPSFGTGGNLGIPYTAGSNGLYQATVASTFSPTPGLSYTLVIDIPMSTDGYQGHWEFGCSIVVRSS